MMNRQAARPESPCRTPGRPAGIRCHAARRKGFTLIELLVVITIILIVSAVALPTVLPALSHRQVSEAARILQAVLAGARDAAIRDNAPSGIRLLPDPTFSGLNASGVLDNRFPLAYNRIIPIETAPEYTEGLVIPWTGALPASVTALSYPGPGAGTITAPTYANTTALMLVEAVLNATGAPNPPTSWFWNIRVGDKVQLNNAGPWYTVIGPMSNAPAAGNAELFVNVGAPGAPSPLVVGNSNPEFLFLVNGNDDNKNGWVDEGWDGVDNDGINGIDDVGEWVEIETWLGPVAASSGQIPYTIRRRPAPTINAREVSLPSNVVIDATSWGLTNERTRVPTAAFNQFSGLIDVLLNPDGTVVATTLYSSPSSLGLAGSFFHFWLAERSDVYAIPVDGNNNPQFLMTFLGTTGYGFYLPMPLGSNLPSSSNGTNSYDMLVASNPTLPVLKGERRIVTLFTRTGQVTTNDNPTFNVFNVNQPFVEAQQGVSGGQQ